MEHSALALTPEILGTALTAYRKQSEITQRDLADAMGMRQATVSALENHTRDSKVDTLYRALSALRLELSIRPIADQSDSDW